LSDHNSSGLKTTLKINKNIDSSGISDDNKNILDVKSSIDKIMEKTFEDKTNNQTNKSQNKIIKEKSQTLRKHISLTKIDSQKSFKEDENFLEERQSLVMNEHTNNNSPIYSSIKTNQAIENTSIDIQKESAGWLPMVDPNVVQNTNQSHNSVEKICKNDEENEIATIKNKVIIPVLKSL
jgi:hypothetical protein